MKLIRLINLLSISLYSLASAQSPAPPATSNNNASLGLAEAIKASGKNDNNSFGSNNLIQGQEVPVFDLSSESVEFMGKKYSLNDSRLEGLFNGYLVKSQADIDKANQYTKKINDILLLLDAGTSGSYKYKLVESAKMLSEAASYPQDHKVCQSLKSSLVMATNALRQADLSDKDILELKKRYKNLIRNQHLEETKTRLTLPTKTEDKAVNTTKNNAGVKTQENIKSRTEISLNIKKAELEGATITNLAKWQYQSMLIQLFMQRRFEHCIIGCRLYTIIFHDMKNDLKLKKGSNLDKFFTGIIGVEPTVSGLDAAASEAIGRTKETIDSVSNHLRIDQVDSATKRMVEAFVIGEHLTVIHTFDPKMRLRMQAYINYSKNLMEASEVRNWQEAEYYTKKLREAAADFRYIKAITAINSYKNASNASLSQFRIAMANQQSETANQHFRQALTFWPTNPKLTSLNSDIETNIDEEIKKKKTLDKKTVEFEDITRNNDFRNVDIKDMGFYLEIFKEAKDNVKLPESQRDTYRKYYGQATELFSGLEKIETAIRTAQGYADQSLYEHAWETIKLQLSEEHVDFSKLKEELNKYSSRASRFRDLFLDAENLMEKENYGSAMSCFLKARQINPKSQLAEAGINKIISLRAK